jgi:folate-dependent phosphoribosylglycinamide formyltransferase PurN
MFSEGQPFGQQHCQETEVLARPEQAREVKQPTILFLGNVQNPFSVGCLQALIELGHDTVIGFYDPSTQGIWRVIRNKLKSRGWRFVLRKGAYWMRYKTRLALRGAGIPLAGFASLPELCSAHRLNVFPCDHPNSAAFVQQAKSLGVDLIVVAAFGRILQRALIEVPRVGCINVHPSFLPRYRGPEPWYWALANGEKTTGVTVHHIDEGIDTGDVILQEELEIHPHETESSLRDRSIQVASGLLRKAVPLLLAGTAPRIPQDHSIATYYSFPPKRALDHGTRGRIQATEEPRAAGGASVPLHAIDPLQDLRWSGFAEKDPRAPVFHIKEQNAQNQALLDYYKCPEEFGEIEVKGKLSEGEGFFQFGPGTLCYGRCSPGRPASRPAGPLFDVSEAVETDQGTVRLPFDLTEVVNNLRRERYTIQADTPRPLRMLRAVVRNVYYFLRPWMPVSIRKHLQRINLSGWHRVPFPQWPVDRTVDTILENSLILCMKAKGISSVPFIWFWPEGARSCAVMTHDVETPEGADFCGELMALDDSFEIKASFQVVPEERYTVSNEFLEELRKHGFEVNVQDLNHDGNLFKDREEFLRRAGRINEYLRHYGSKGFRSAVLYRNAEWLEAIEASYDMSFPNVAHLDPQRGGCCTIMPYFIGRIVELPLTTTQDYTLFHILAESSINLWKQQIELIRERNGLISFIVHPDYLKGKREMGLYKSLLAYLYQLRAESKLWIALPGEVDLWWRARDRMKLVCHNQKWRIEGEDSQRARIAYAILEGDRITYSFETSC